MGRMRTTFLAGLLLLAVNAAGAETYRGGTIEIGDAWTRATPKGSPVAGGYMTITNKGTETDRLISGSTPVASVFQVHKMFEEQGVMKMRPVEGGLEIRPGETVELKPNSFHVMLQGLQQPLKQGEKVKATLVFEKAGKIDIEFSVLPLGAVPAGH